MTNIQKLQYKLNNSKQDTSKIVEQLQLEYNKKFKRNESLNKAIDELNKSNKYSTDEQGEIVQWIGFDFGDFKDCMDYLTEYLSEYHFIITDFKNDNLYMRLGPNIIINEDYDVYDQDSGKVIVKKLEYYDSDSDYNPEDPESELKRNELIEAWMQKTGYFPEVFKVDRYNNVFHVNTQPKDKK
jgi:hypothetical protein